MVSYYIYLAKSTATVRSFKHHATQSLWAEVSLDVPILPEETTAISFITELKEYCQKHKLGIPGYKVLPTQRGGGFCCLVTIAGEPYTGAIRLDEEEAKESAAEFAVQKLAAVESEV